ncbi:MAG: hypothetical protein OHK005_20540 [Candidatus Methylacidiphilales bacterium]
MAAQGFVRSITFILCLALVMPLSVEAIETGEDLVPGLGEVIPLEKQNGRVVFRYATLLNPSAIVPAGSVARTVFTLPRPTDSDVRTLRHRDDKKAAYSAIKLPDTRAAPLSPEAMAAQERALKTVWDDDMRFRSALLRMRLAEVRLIYENPRTGEIEAQSFTFPENLFLAEVDGAVTVLAVGSGSRAERLGLKTGARITAINGKPLDNGLASFQRLYLPEKNASQEAGQPLVFSTILPGETTPQDVAFPQVGATQVHDFFNAVDVVPEKSPPAAPRPTAPESFDPFAPRKP